MASYKTTLIGTLGEYSVFALAFQAIECAVRVQVHFIVPDCALQFIVKAYLACAPACSSLGDV